MNHNIHNIETAPDAAKPLLESAQKAFGFLPNLLGVLAASPATLEAYLTLNKLLGETSLTPVEQQVAILAISAENDCHYCMAAHSVVGKMTGVSEADIQSLRNETPIADAKLEALRDFAKTLVAKRGWADESDMEAFFSAGYTRQSALDVVLAVSFKIISNYTNHIFDTPLDDAFAKQAWQKPERVIA